MTASSTAPPITPAVGLAADEVDFYNANGYLHLRGVYGADEVAEMNAELGRAAADWGTVGGGWKSPVNAGGESQVLVMHRLEYFSPAWDRARQSPRLVAAAVDLLGHDVEYIGSSTHTKPALHGGGFPMHQDSPFYGHETHKLLICMVHLDDTFPANGPISFNSRPVGAITHIPHTRETDPADGGNYLDPQEYRLVDAVPVECRAGDVVIFNIFRIHGSGRNGTESPRRAVVFRYRDPLNRQTRGDGGPFTTDPAGFGIMAHGARPARPGYRAAPGGNVHVPQPRPTNG